MISQIEAGDFSCMIEQNIQPSTNIEENKKLFYRRYVLYQRYAAVVQMRQGLSSVSEKLLNKCFLKYMTFNVLQKLKVREAELGSFRCCNDRKVDIGSFELKHFLMFCTG